ncbi:hypothetical protein SAMN02799631_03222 [Methylobacterium sp. 174MFSha1.1]|nr:hypothetical protein SAMN02799631_03222 [Methylobacterium sp. 174MFSha1.1]
MEPFLYARRLPGGACPDLGHAAAVLYGGRMKLDITLWNGTAQVPYAPAKTVRGRELGGGASILKHVGGPQTKPESYATIDTVRVSVPATKRQAAWSHAFPVKGSSGSIRVPAGSTVVVVWQGLSHPALVQVRDAEAVRQIRAARKQLTRSGSASSAPSSGPKPSRPRP